MSTREVNVRWGALTVDLCDLHVRRGQVVLLTQHLGRLVGICRDKQSHGRDDGCARVFGRVLHLPLSFLTSDH